MRHNKRVDTFKAAIKYAVLNKTTNKVAVCRFKTQVAALIGVSTRTLDRNINYSNEQYTVYLVGSVV